MDVNVGGYECVDEVVTECIDVVDLAVWMLMFVGLVCGHRSW